MILHQSNKFKHKYFKYFMGNKVETLQAFYISSFGIKIRHIAHNLYYKKIAIIFMKLNHILLKKILENSDFVSLNLAVTANKKKEMYTIILYFYKLNTQIR